jgi:signal peptidase II
VKARYFYLIALAVIALDQISKLLVTSRLPFGMSVPAVQDVLYITLVRNRGGAFGLFQSWAGALIIITLAAAIAIIVVTRRGGAMPRLLGVALALQLGGALGNLIDRLRFGYVVDFFDFRVWPVFNLADSAITVGVALLAYYLIFCDKPREAGVLASGRSGKG